MEEDARDLVLVVVADPDIQDLICHQTLDPVGYQVEIAADASEAVSQVARLSPDCIITDLDLPGLNARDMLVMLQAQGLEVPVIVLARKGDEARVIQAFRLGAEDYLLYPLREPEILNVVERVLKHAHTRRQRQRMECQVQQANAELQQRVRELTTIYAVGKAVTSTTDLTQLCEKILEGSIQVTEAEIGWLLLRDEATKAFFLVAHRHLPAQYAAYLHKTWDDGISLLVAKAGKMLSLHGESLQRFPISKLGQSILIVPIKAQNQVIGLLVMLHRQPTPFSPSAIHLLEAVADFASISLMNARMFLAVEERLRAYQKTDDGLAREKISLEMIRNFNREQAAIIEGTVDTLEKLAKVPAAHWTTRQREELIRLRDQIESLIHLAEATATISG